MARENRPMGGRRWASSTKCVWNAPFSFPRQKQNELPLKLKESGNEAETKNIRQLDRSRTCLVSSGWNMPGSSCCWLVGSWNTSPFFFGWGVWRVPESLWRQPTLLVHLRVLFLAAKTFRVPGKMNYFFLSKICPTTWTKKCLQLNFSLNDSNVEACDWNIQCSRNVPKWLRFQTGCHGNPGAVQMSWIKVNDSTEVQRTAAGRWSHPLSFHVQCNNYAN